MKRMHKKGCNRKEGGVTLVMVSMALLVITAAAALSLDLGMVWYERSILQRASDAGALAGVLQVQTTTTAVTSDVNDVVATNDVSPGTEVDSITCGTFIPTYGAQSFVARDCASTQANAVKVNAHRTFASILAGVVGITQFTPRTESIAMTIFANSGPCLRPFGIVG